MSRSNHWIWQPRDSRGRFSSGGGYDNDTFDMNGFWKLPDWGKVVYIAAMFFVLAVVPGIILRAIVFIVVLLGSDAILNALLPDEEEESEE